MKLIVCALIVTYLSTELRGMDRITGRLFASRSEVIAQNGMIATSQPLATQVGLEVLKEGGTAVDAAIAANAVLGLVEPTGCGIGGDLFAIVWSAQEKRLFGLNASGRSPQSLTFEEFERRQLESIPKYGPLPVTVPGCVDGWFELHAKFGRLPIERLLEPAIAYAEEGFPVSELIAYYWDRSVPILGPQEGFLDTFAPQGRAPRKGEIFKNPKLARTLRTIASEGRDAFYCGSIAETIDGFMKRVGGFLTAEDLAEHRSEWIDPVSTNYRGYDVWQLPPNGQGIAVLQMLNILEGFPLREYGFLSPEYVHCFLEAKKLVFEDRAKFYSDPAFNDIPVAQLISKEYAAKRRRLINPEEAADTYPAGNPALEAGDTIYLSVADREGNMISLIQSNYRGMGSGLSPDGLGFILQDRGELFSLDRSDFNVYAPGKRPFHTIIPGFVTRDGQPHFSFGVMGGATQPQAQVWVLSNLIDFGMNFQEAGDAPRVIHQKSSQPTGSRMKQGGEVLAESTVPYETVRELIKLGHDVRYGVGPFGGYQGIGRVGGVYYGASESRKDGQAAGY